MTRLNSQVIGCDAMDRRRFLKYAGATAAVVGVSALGLDYVLRPSPLPPI
jgi:hypothetical protein